MSPSPPEGSPIFRSCREVDSSHSELSLPWCCCCCCCEKEVLLSSLVGHVWARGSLEASLSWNPSPPMLLLSNHRILPLVPQKCHLPKEKCVFFFVPFTSCLETTDEGVLGELEDCGDWEWSSLLWVPKDSQPWGLSGRRQGGGKSLSFPSYTALEHISESKTINFH